MTINEPIFERITEAVALSKGVALFVGRKEWSQMVALCEKWGVTWPDGIEGYNPDKRRATFAGVPVYRVDAEEFLVAK